MTKKKNDTCSSYQPEKYVGISELSSLLGIPIKTIYKWCSESPISRFPYYKIGRWNRFKISEVEEYLRKYKSSIKLEE